MSEKIYNVILIDGSNSMSKSKNEIISGLNNVINSIKTKDDNIIFRSE